MKALTCEMCGSTNLIKQDGVFVCKSCGTKYSVEEAKKMMIEGTVDVKGTVTIDTSSELANLYEIARRAKETDNSENAAKYYDMILVKDPKSWEANFYVIYFKAMNCTIGQIDSAGYSVVSSLPSIFDLVQETVPNDEQELVFKEIQNRCSFIAKMLSNAAEQSFYNLDLQDFSNDIISSSLIVHSFADLLEDKYNGLFGQMSAQSWKESIDILLIYTNHFTKGEHLSNIQKIIDEYGDKIKKYDSSYITPKVDSEEGESDDVISNSSTSTTTNKSNGCYVATAVYGSYDCPEVWTLRRFRDYTLDETFAGRTFIKTYYAISPTLVRILGDTSWFKAMWKPILDKIVSKLQNMGIESTPYKDKY